MAGGAPIIRLNADAGRMTVGGAAVREPRTRRLVLGHSTMRVTERYAKVVPELHHEAAAAMDRVLGSVRP